MRRLLGVGLFVCFWLCLFLSPPLREMVRQDLPPALALLPDRETRANFYATDIQVQVEKAKSNNTHTDTRTLERILSANPQMLWIRAVYLQKRLVGLKSDRNEGPLLNPNYPAPPPGNPIKVPVKDWENLIAVAREGNRLDPKNAYFDQFILCGLLALRRDDEAFEVLKRAANKTHYDAFVREIAQHHVSAEDKLKGPLSSGQKLEAIWSTDSFSTYAQMRQMARWIREVSFEEQAKGNPARSLAWCWNLVRLGRNARLHSYTVIDSLVMQAIESMAMFPGKGIKGRRKPIPGAKTLSIFRADTSSGSFLARRSGDVALARQFEQEWVSLGGWSKGVDRWMSSSSFAFGDNFKPALSGKFLTFLFLVETVRRLAIWPLPLLVLSWLAAWGCTRFLFSRERIHKQIQTSCVSSWKWGFGLSVFLIFIFTLGDSSSRLVASLTSFGSPPITSLLTTAPAMIWRAGVVSEAGLLFLFPMWAWGVPSMGIFLLSLWLTRFSRRSSRKSLWKQVTQNDGIARIDISPIVSIILRFSLWTMGITIYFALLIVPLLQEWSAASTKMVGFWIPVVGFPSIVALYLLALSRLQDRVGLWRDWVQNWCGATCGALVALTFIYMVSIGLSVPLNAKYEQGWKQYMVGGEMAVARSSAKF